MKKTILLSSILAVGAVFAETTVTSGNAIGALDLTISTTRPQTLVSVPFLGYNGGAVAVQDMVKTSNLGEGSKLYVANGSGGYDTWTLQEGTWTPNKKVTIGPNGAAIEGVTIDQSEATVARGGAFWIEPVNPESGKIYLLGQGVTTAGSSTVVPNVWNLVGNTAAEAKTISTSGYTAGDKICVQKDNTEGTLLTYTYRSKEPAGWYKAGKLETLTIQPGQGFWFFSKVTTSIAW